ncbi:hypothetical protein HDU97_001969 [Phlyctochytrium planicorne]|nr:hypothetical protein HDU97_001969 [Phlyctochytrium planicorne]
MTDYDASSSTGSSFTIPPSLRARILQDLQTALGGSHPLIKTSSIVNCDSSNPCSDEILVDVTFNADVPVDLGEMSFTVKGPSGSILDLQPKAFPSNIATDLPVCRKTPSPTNRTFSSTATVYHSVYSDIIPNISHESSLPLTGPFSTTLFVVDGMNCIYCADVIASGLRGLKGVAEVEAPSNQPQLVRVKHSLMHSSVEKVRQKIEDLGFRVIDFDTKVEATDVIVKIGTQESTPLMKSTLMIHGMTCAACTSSLTQILKDLTGVCPSIPPVVTLLPHQRAVVCHDPTVLSPETIASRIEDAGFDVLEASSEPFASPSLNEQGSGKRALEDVASLATLDGASPPPLPQKDDAPKTVTTRIIVRKMTCSGCTEKIEEGLRLKRGVVSVSVSLLTNKATILHDPSIIGPRDLLSVLSHLGFSGEIDSGSSREMKYKEIHRRELRLLLIQTIIGGIFAIPTVVIAMIIGMLLPMENNVRIALYTPIIPGLSIAVLTLLLMATIVQFGLGWRFYRGSYKAIFKMKAANMDVLIALGTSAAYFYSVGVVFAGMATETTEEEQFFETSILLIFFVLLGRLLEVYAKGKTTDAVEALVKLTPQSTILILHEMSTKDPDGFKIIGERTIPVNLVQVGDILKVPVGSRFPADGFVVRGNSAVDEALLNGEPMPVEKNPGDSIIGGSTNVTHVLLIKVTKAGSETFISQIARLVEDAQSLTAPIQSFADSVSKVFVPTVLIIALVTLIFWLAAGRWLLGEGVDFKVTALKFSVAVLVVACPCALGLAVPTAVMVSTGVAAKMNILISGGGAAMQRMEDVTCIAFDKTGTLTEGKALVTSVEVDKNLPMICPSSRFWSMVSNLASSSNHPLSKAINTYIIKSISEDSGINIDQLLSRNVSELAGLGLSGEFSEDGHLWTRVILGSRKWIEKNGIILDPPNIFREKVDVWEGECCTGVYVAIFSLLEGDGSNPSYEGTIAAAFAISDNPRPTSAPAIRALLIAGVDVHMVSGDSPKTAHAIAAKLGISPHNVWAGLRPEEKSEKIKGLKGQANLKSKWKGFVKKDCQVAFVGDGINDAVALAAADVGIAIGTGSEVAQDSASVILTRSNVFDVVAFKQLASATMRRVRWNLLWALVYNVMGIPIAAGLLYPFTKLVLQPWMAGLMMAGSSVCVVVSSLMLKRFRVKLGAEPIDSQFLVSS